MLAARVVPLAGIGWSFGVIALVLKSGLLVAPVPLQPTLDHDPVSLSVAVLEQTETFKSSAVGVAGITPNDVLAWRIVFNSPDRDEIFRHILATGSVPGQLYALAGLWFGDAKAFVAQARIVSSRGGSVRIVRGCIVSTANVTDLVREIQNGEWTREFLVAGRPVPVR